VAVALAVALASGCKEHPRRSPPQAAASPHVPPGGGALPAALPSAAPGRTPAAPSPAVTSMQATYDAGASSCRLVFGPSLQPFVGEPALAPNDAGVLLVTHRDGVPIVTRVVAAAMAAPLVTDAPAPRVPFPPCVAAAGFAFCMDRAGGIHRRALDGDAADVIAARARPGTPFAAEAVATGHVVVVYLADRHTSEGVVTAAYATLDDGPPVALSDEGSGATHVTLAPRGGALLALALDGRSAMTPAHARTLTAAGGQLRVGEDDVVFVGGGAEANTRAALGVSATGASFALIPIARDVGFGLTTVRIDEPPRMDEPATWYAYANGLDPAPIAATHGTSPIRVARVRPLDGRFDAPWGLELGSLDDGGAFRSHGLVASRGRVRSAALAADRAGLLWLAYTDSAGTWLERRACP